MKIAYLVHSDREYDELVETINQLIKQGDHVFIMINDNDLRDKIRFVYADDQRVHISSIQEFAQEGDLSLARGTIIQMKEAIELGGFDYFINLTDGMIPIKSRTEIISCLEANSGNDFYYIDRSEKDDATLRKKTLKYYTVTSLIAFTTSKFVRGSAKLFANILALFALKRKLDDTIVIGSPWFIITRKSALTLVENYSYVSTNFKLSWYPEEMYIGMMMNKYVHKNDETHINKDMRYIGPNGTWEESSGGKVILTDSIQSDALFAAKITVEGNFELYEKYYNIYNCDYIKKEEDIVKEKTFIDPSTLL